jgi:diaminopimelate epimerase
MRKFSKMHGAGNDFIVADDRDLKWPRNADFIRRICDRRHGIGADGFILLSAPSSFLADITMSFFNCDGKSAEMCGNGLRCAALFARRHLLDKSKLKFCTDAGILGAEIIDKKNVTIEIPVNRQPEKISIEKQDCYSVDTGVPHLVLLCDDVNQIDLCKEGCKLRNHALFQPVGTNVNFVSIQNDKCAPVFIRTYERGVEGETPACGTGIAAAGLALVRFCDFEFPVKFITAYSDTITVDFFRNDNMVVSYTKILLTGPAVEVYTGSINKELFE